MATEPKRVLVLIKGLGLGGAETLIAQSARVWDRSRFEYKVAYLLPWKDHLVPDLEDQEVNVVSLEWRGLGSISALSRLRELVNDWQPDIIHSHLPAAGVLARLLLRGPHVYTEHNIVDFYKPLTKAANRWTYGRNSAIISVSEAVADSTRSYPGPAPDVVPNGIGRPSPGRGRQDVRAELGLTDDKRLIVHVGNIRPHKGQANLVRAIEVLKRTRSDFLAISIGSEKTAGDIDRLRSLAASLGVSEEILFLGQRPDAVSYMAAADVVVNPADVEGLPVSVLEAMALQRPVVATSVGGVPTVIKDRSTGLLVPPGEPEELGAALAEALDSSRAIDWGARAAETVESTHGIETMVRAYENIYERILA